MPRMQTPKGYYTATEVKKILNISDRMVRIHVEKGRIKYTVPPGRKQGFYLKKDVDRLTNELHVFLNLDEEEGKITFTRASESDLPEIINIGTELFGGGDADTRVTPLEERAARMKKNPDIFYTLKKDNEVIGFTHILPFKEGTDKIDELLRVDFAGQVNITLDDIEEFKPGKHVELYIVAIGMKPSVRYPQKRRYAARLISNLMERIIELGRDGVIIETITAIGYSPEGRRLLTNFGFSEVLPPAPGKRAFHIKIAESGTPLILQYKEALQESGYYSELEHESDCNKVLSDSKTDSKTERKPATIANTDGQTTTKQSFAEPL